MQVRHRLSRPAVATSKRARPSTAISRPSAGRRLRVVAEALPAPVTTETSGTGTSVVAHFKADHPRTIEEITAAPAGGFTDGASTRRGPILVSVDHTAEAANAIKWALTHLCYPGEQGEQLELVHVVCDPRSMESATGVGSTPTGSRARLVDVVPEAVASHSYREYSQTLLTRAHELVERTCGHLLAACEVPYQLHLPRLPGPRSAATIGEVLLREADRLGARALVVASHGPGAMVEYGSVARYCYQHAPLPLVLIPSGNPQFFGTTSFDFPPDSELTPYAEFVSKTALRERSGEPALSEDEVVAHSAPATAAHVPPPSPEPPADATAPPSSQPPAVPAHREVLLVVSHLPELEAHWQWVADNLCRRGDVLTIWHVQSGEAGSPTASSDSNLASLPTALAQVLKSRGLADVRYTPVYASGGPGEVARKVVAAAEVPNGPRMVCVLNYARQGLLREALQGSVASELARHCPVPLVLLEPPLSA